MAFYLLKVQSSPVLAQKNTDVHWLPASTPKLMTVYILLRETRSGQIPLSTMLLVSEKAWKARNAKGQVLFRHR